MCNFVHSPIFLNIQNYKIGNNRADQLVRVKKEQERQREIILNQHVASDEEQLHLMMIVLSCQSLIYSRNNIICAIISHHLQIDLSKIEEYQILGQKGIKEYLSTHSLIDNQLNSLQYSLLLFDQKYNKKQLSVSQSHQTPSKIINRFIKSYQIYIMLILIEAFCRVALFVIQMLYAIQAKLSTSYKNAKDNMYRKFIKVYYKNENEWLKTQLNKINKQPYHLILVMNNSVQLHHIIQLIQYVTLTNTKFVTIYDIKGQLAEHIPKLHSDILSKQFTKTYNQRTIQLNSFIQDKKQVQYEIKNEGEPLYIQFLDNSANQKDLLQLIKRSIQKNEDIVFERDLVSYKIINSIEGKDTVNMKSYSTALLIQFDHQFFGLYGLPFQFLKSSEMIFGQNILNFTYTKFLKSYQTYAYLQQREGK